MEDNQQSKHFQFRSLPNRRVFTMSRDHTIDAGQPPSERASFHTAADHAAGAFHDQLQRLPVADQRTALTASKGSPFGDDLQGRIVKAIGANEGSLTRITLNDNGHGISIGIRQCNQGRGELPDLLRSMHDKDPHKFDSIFGPYAKNLMHENWVRHANMAGNPDLLRRLGTALREPEFQKVQIDTARDFAQKSIDTAKRYGLQTEQGAALVADMTNQLGAGGARRILAEAGLRPGHVVQNEKLILARMEHLTRRPNSRDRFNSIAANFGNGALINQFHIADGTHFVA